MNSSTRSHGSLLLALLVATSCSAPAVESTPVEQVVPSVADWTPEHIPFPPGFAPGLPPGSEDLLFAPGMFEEGAEDFWSYAFVIDLDEELAGVEALDDFIEQYYDGLLAAVGEGKGEVPEDPAQAEVRELGSGRYEARVALLDTFVTFAPLDLTMRIDLEPRSGGGTRLAVRASPQDDGHRVWSALEAAILALRETASATSE